MSRLVVFSGAGFSAESNIPVFRGGGLWNEYDIHEVCDFRTLKKNRAAIEAFYDSLRRLSGECHPHDGYGILKDISSHYDEALFFTSNVDDLHEKADIQCEHVHGRICDIHCLECGKFSDIGVSTLSEALENGLVQHFSGCSCAPEALKPGVTFFHEDYAAYPAFAHLSKTLRGLEKNDVLLVIGSSLDVIPVDYWVRHTRCHKYNINPVRQAGHGSDARHWRNIMNTSIAGLGELKAILKPYWG